MRAVQLHAFGGPEVLQLVDIPRPDPAPGEVRIRVLAAGVNFADVIRRRNGPYPFPTPLPFLPGSEVSGVIDALGDGVTTLHVGQHVFALAGTGPAAGSTGYAEYTLAGATQVVPLPPSLAPDVAAGVLVAGTSALLMLREVARVQPGDRVFIAAGAGGVGSFAIALAHRLGAAQVLAGVGSASKEAAARAAGADTVLRYDDPHWPDAVRGATGGAGVDVLLEMRGGGALEAGLQALAPFGRLVIYGAASDARYTLSPAALGQWLEVPGLQQSVHAFNLGLWFAMRGAVAGAAIGDLVTWLASGDLIAPPITTLPLADAATAHARLEGRSSTGKLVLIPST